MKTTMKIERLINDPNVNKDKLFYDAINKISNRSSISIHPLRDPSDDSVIASTDKEIADELHKYEKKHIAFHDHVDCFVNNYKNNTLETKICTVFHLTRSWQKMQFNLF